MKKLLTAFTVIALAVAANAATKYNVTLFQPSVVNGAELKPGDYKVEITGDKAVFTQGKKSVEAPVKVEDTTEKISTNAVRYTDGVKVQEIRIAGTHTKLVFSTEPNTETPTAAR